MQRVTLNNGTCFMDPICIGGTCPSNQQIQAINVTGLMEQVNQQYGMKPIPPTTTNLWTAIGSGWVNFWSWITGLFT